MKDDRIVLMKPYLPVSARDAARKQMDSRWLGQGPRVDEFEKMFEEKISHNHKAIAVNSGTSALHLAYILAGIKEGDEVVGPVFTCSATFSGLLYQRAKPVFADIQKDTLNIDPDHVRELFKQRGERIKAIVVVHYAGHPVDLDEINEIAKEWNVPVIEDAAQAVGAVYKGQNIGSISPFTCFSFQAVKTITTADGGMLTIGDPMLEEKAKRTRWFGIDRKAKFEDRWKNDIWEVGYKYQMTDIAASMGIEGLRVVDEVVAHQKVLFETYRKELKGIAGIKLLCVPQILENSETKPSYWLCTAQVEKRDQLRKKLLEHNIESDPTHYRCDRYTVYGGRVYNCPNMDYLEDKYLLLPMHYHVAKEDIHRIAEVIRGGW